MAFAVAGSLVNGVVAREPRVNLGPALANAYWQFTLTGSSTPASVYQDQNLTTAFSTNQVIADSTGSFPPIYLDPSVIYRVQLFSALGVLVRGPYDNFQSALPTWGTSQQQATGPKITPFNEVTSTNSAGGSGNAWTITATQPGGACVRVYGPSPGGLTLEVDSSATTGAQTATFTATNKPGIATSAPVAWLSIKCDGQVYYTPLWRGDTFVPPTPSMQQAVGQVISCASVTFNGDGTTTLTGTGASATPSSWYTPPVTGIGSGYWINVTQTGGAGSFSGITPGTWTNITSGGLTIASSGGAASGTYQLSTSNTGTPVVASGTIACSFTPVLRVYTSGSGTETIPNGATNVTLEDWGPGGGGGANTSTSFAGSGAGAGAYSKVTISVASLGGVGKTFNWAVGAAGTGSVGNPGTTGTSTSVSAGTVTGFSTIKCPSGTGGQINQGGGGTGGVPTNANAGATNTTGAPGNANRFGGASTAGSVPGDGQSTNLYGQGGNGHVSAVTGAGGTGVAGAAVFYYT